jgi:two-component system chemotaxis response regulator CheB
VIVSRPIRVLIVDDSALVRRALTDRLSGHPDIEVIGTAVDPYAARDKILELQPDVLTLDIEMPRMDGLTFLRLLMKNRPMPVIILSSLTTSGSAAALEALQAGAVEVLAKPSGSHTAFADGERLAQIVRAAAVARLHREPGSLGANGRSHGVVRSGPGRVYNSRFVILIGASTGGTEAIKRVLTQLPADVPGICIVQHMPAKFSQAFASRLHSLCAFEVREARHGDVVRPGLALVAPGGEHLLLKKEPGHYRVVLSNGPMIHYQRPAVDVLFDSAVKSGVGPDALAMVLTGMGSDGAAGLLGLHQAGADTVAQDESTCVVFGMPKEAIRLGAARKVLPVQHIPSHIQSWCDRVALRAVEHSP